MEGMLMLLVMMVIAMVLAWMLDGKQRKQAVSLLLCAAMMSSYIPVINVAKADSAAKPVLVNEQVLVNGTKTTQIGAVTYSSSGSAYTLDTSSARVRVKNGDSISFDGAISAPEGETISWVRVDVYDANTEEPYTVGAEYYRADGLKVQQYDLSNIPALTIGEAFGSKDYALAEGGKYIVMFCVGDSNGNAFADMDADIEEDQGPAILVDVKLSPSNCKHPHSDYVYILHSSGEVRKQSYGDSMTHQVEPLYERYCGLCDTFLMNIWGEGTSEEHSMDSNGVCLGCGYYAEPMMSLTYAARISSLEFTSPNDGDEVQVGEFVTVEWEKKDGTEEYVVYVKLLDGEPDNGSDNEIGTLLDNQQNWKYTEYTMVIPENAAGKWIKFNVHGKTSAGEQTEAASSLYVYVRSDEYEEDPTTCTHEYSEEVIDKECYDRGDYSFHWYCEEIEYYCSKCGDTYTEWTTEDDQVYEGHNWNKENSTCVDCGCVLPQLTMDYFEIEDNYKVGDVFSFAGEINGNESNISRVSINVKKPNTDSKVHLSTIDVNSFTYNLWDVADIELDEAGEYGIFIWAVDAAGNGLNSEEAEAGTGTFVYWFTVVEPQPPRVTEDLNVSPKVVMEGESVSISGMVAGTEGSKLKNIQVSVFDHDNPEKGGVVCREESLSETYWYDLSEIQIDTDTVYGNLEIGVGVYDVVVYVTDEYGLGLEEDPIVTFEVVEKKEDALLINSHRELTEIDVGDWYTVSWSNGNSYAYIAETIVLDGEPTYSENEAGVSQGTIRLDGDNFSGVATSEEAGKYLKIIIYGIDENGNTSQDADYVYFYVNPVEVGCPTIEDLVIDESVPVGGQIYVGGTVKGNGAALTDIYVTIRKAEDENQGAYLGEYGSFYTNSFELGYAYQTGVTVGDLFLGEGEYIVEVYATDENGNGFAERQHGNLTITPHDPTYGVSILSHNYYGQIEENEEVTVSWLDGYSDRYVVNVMYLDGDPTAGDPDTGTSVATDVIVEGDSYTFTAPDVDAEDKWVKFSVYGIQSDSTEVMEYESTVYLRTVPAASKPTIENFTASETEVSVGDTISLSGVINGNGTQLRAVQVSVFEHDNHENGVVFYHSGSIFMDEFDLSAVMDIQVGEAVGDTDFVLTEGQYDIVLYATNADGNGFESAPIITVTVGNDSNNGPVIEGFRTAQNNVLDWPQDYVYFYNDFSFLGTIDGRGNLLDSINIIFTDIKYNGTGSEYNATYSYSLIEDGVTEYNLKSIVINPNKSIPKLMEGEYQVQIEVKDEYGNVATATMEDSFAVICNEYPVLEVTSSKGTEFCLMDDTAFCITATKDSGISRVEWCVAQDLSTTETKTIYSYEDEFYYEIPYIFTKLGSGTLIVKVFDRGGAQDIAYLKFNVTDGLMDISSPVIDPITCTVASPITAGTEVTFSTTAADDVKLAKIELFIDGELKKTEAVSGQSGTISYTTSALAIGDHEVKVVATDASGLTNDVSLTVTVQKADPSTCAHLNTTVITDPQCVKVDEQMHQWIYTYWTHCLDCNTGLSSVQDEDLPEKHTWKDGACEKCEHACSHNFELVVNEKGENVAVVGSGKWQRQDDDYHVCTEIKYQTKCATCGLMGESDYKPAGWTEKHDYKWAAGGVDRNDAQHRFYEEHICSLAACSDRKTIGEWENHQYVNGICSCGAKESNNNGGSSSDNATNGNNTNNNSGSNQWADQIQGNVSGAIEGIITGIEDETGNVDDGDDEFNGTSQEYTTNVERLPHHFGDYQLADQIQGNVNPTMAAVYAAIAGGVYDNIATIVMSNVAQNSYEKEMYKKALVRVMADVPSTELTEKQQAELKAISGLSSFLNDQGNAVDKIAELIGYTDDESIESLALCVKLVSQTLDSYSEISDEGKEILEAQFYGKILYFEALKANAGSVKPLLDAINELEKEYTDRFVVKVKDFAQATVDGAFDWGKEIGTDFIDLAIESAGDEATANALKHISSVLKGLEIADFALGVIDEVGGYGEYAEGYQELLVLDAIQGTIACSYLETVFDLQSKVEDGEQLTDEEYAYLVACYDLMRGCLISKNMSARKIWERTENQVNRQEVLEQLRHEIDQLKEMSIDEWQLNEYYRDDFFETPSATINQGYYFDAIIDGGEYSAKAENEDEKIGIASKYDELSSLEKDVVNETKDGLARFANAYASSADNATFKLTLVENKNKLSSAIIIEDGSGNAMILACESLYGNPWVKVVDADALNYQLSNNELDVECVMSNGYVQVIETALSDKRTTWTINKAGVESILREYVDNQQAQINDDPKVSISKNEEFTMDLLKTVLDHNPWDSFEGLSKQVVAEEYKP